MAKAGRPPEPWKREHILDTAATVLTKRGVKSTGIQDLADAAGVSRASIHYHFAGVEGVVLSVAERGFQLMYTRRLAAIELETDPRAQLVTLMRMGIPESPPSEYVVMYESIGVFRGNSEFLPIMENLSQRQFELYEQVIGAGLAAGHFSPREPIESIGWNLLAIEDASGIYITLGTASPVETMRDRMITYASSSLDCDLRAENARQLALGIG